MAVQQQAYPPALHQSFSSVTVARGYCLKWQPSHQRKLLQFILRRDIKPAVFSTQSTKDITPAENDDDDEEDDEEEAVDMEGINPLDIS